MSGLPDGLVFTPLTAADRAAACEVMAAAYGQVWRPVVAEKLWARPVRDDEQVVVARADGHDAGNGDDGDCRDGGSIVGNGNGRGGEVDILRSGGGRDGEDGARDEGGYGGGRGGEVVGVLVVSGPYVRVLAVVPTHQRRGVGQALLSHAEQLVRASGYRQVVMHAQPGNYLMPGVGAHNAELRGWLERRGYVAGAEAAHLHAPWPVAPASEDAPHGYRVVSLRSRLGAHGSAAGVMHGAGHRDDPASTLDDVLHDSDVAQPPVAQLLLAQCLEFARHEFSEAWALELRAALASATGDVWVALADDAIAAFAAYDGNNAGLATFGPAGTHPAHRGRGLGAHLLRRCLEAMATRYATTRPHATIAWAAAHEFYRAACGATVGERFVDYRKPL